MKELQDEGRRARRGTYEEPRGMGVPSTVPVENENGAGACRERLTTGLNVQ